MHHAVRVFFLSLSLLFAGWLVLGRAAPEQPAQPYRPRVAPASREGRLALQRIRVPQGMKIDLYAAEPLLANPVAFCFDGKGNCYVAETFRLHAGVTDNRGHMNWLDDDLALRTVADRVAMYRKYLKGRFKDYEREHDRVRMLVDTKGVGKADKATVFADGFNRAQDGIGAGLLARKGNVYFTCIPDLWLLKDTKGNGKANVRKSLSSGYGVHVSFIGHDMHGLRMGPDGKLYFSIGDRGLNVRTREGKHLFYPDTGAVLRCDPDGANLEVVATGLRNPQELAFDDFGNLFTVDNNCDAGDQARLVYVVEGGDSGWRIGYQYDSAALGSRGPWHYEKLWHLPHPGQPAYIVPPLAHFTAGPSGLTHYPGVGLKDRYAGHFFVCDFRGNPGGSGVWSFAVKPKGAAFTLTDPHHFVWSILATDCEFGPDGGFYVSDWVDGWNLTGKGRIYRVTDPEQMKKPVIAEVKKLLAEGFDKRPVKELVKLLGHAHQQVRLEAQFALAEKGTPALAPLTKVAKTSKNRLARLHAIWGLGMAGRKEARAFATVEALTRDADIEVRAQAAKVLGQGPDRGYQSLTLLLKDPEPRVRLQAGLALSENGRRAKSGADANRRAKRVFQAVSVMLADNADRDGYLRHAGVQALANNVPSAMLSAATRVESPAVRLAACLALRRQKSPEVARFLADADLKIVAEAARAIHDVPIPGALPKLAALVAKPTLPNFILYRALNANFRLGTSGNAAAVANFAANPRTPESVRVEALKLLDEWNRPRRRDRITGFTQSIPPRKVERTEALKPVLGGLFRGPNKVRREAARVAAKLGIKEIGPVLMEMLSDRKRPVSVRVESLRGLVALRDRRLEQAVEQAIKSDQAALRHEGRSVLSRLHPRLALKLLEQVLSKGEVHSDSLAPVQRKLANRTARQRAFAVLGTMNDEEAKALLGRWMGRLLAGEVEPGLHLDLLEAARAFPSAAVKKQLARYEAARKKGDPLAPYREALVGGNARQGRHIFFHKGEVSCLRCHKVQGQGGEVGPDLSGIGARQNRAYLLESIVAPDRQIAKGFETVVLITKKGKPVAGIVKAEDKTSVKLMTAEGKLVTVRKKDIDERQKGKSAMPADAIKYLTRRELRDLVEFLAGLKDSTKK